MCAKLLCTYGASALHPVRGVMTVNPVLCQGCGACAARGKFLAEVIATVWSAEKSPALSAGEGK